jgi:beta-barrel assembly-enhancing protease
MLNRLLIVLTACLLAAAAGANPHRDLPDIGSQADTVFTRGQADAIGRTIVRQLREQGAVLEDPEIADYIQSIGLRIAAQAHEGDYRFEFFVVNDDVINAFALPGGYIGINTGLITATRSESELAGVLAHEIAHVTQKHIARRISATGRTSILATAAVIAAIMLGAGGDVVPAAIMSAQGLAMQEQINYTRANEYEADRVGLHFLAQAGFDPMGMPSFFEVLSRQAGTPGSRAPEFLQTHPLSSTRVAETRNRAERTEAREVTESPTYDLMRARIRALNARTAEEALGRFRTDLDREGESATAASRYGWGLALLRAGRFEEALPVFQQLRDEDEATVVFHAALGETLILVGRADEGLEVFATAAQLFPRNRPLTVRYAEALIRTGKFENAHVLLLDLFNNVRPTPPQARLIANAADAAGETAEALFYMSEYHLLNGQLHMALEKLRLALREPGLQGWQKARFEARIAELEPFLDQRRTSRRQSETQR